MDMVRSCSMEELYGWPSVDRLTGPRRRRSGAAEGTVAAVVFREETKKANR